MSKPNEILDIEELLENQPDLDFPTLHRLKRIIQPLAIYAITNVLVLMVIEYRATRFMYRRMGEVETYAFDTSHLGYLLLLFIFSLPFFYFHQWKQLISNLRVQNMVDFHKRYRKLLFWLVLNGIVVVIMLIYGCMATYFFVRDIDSLRFSPILIFISLFVLFVNYISQALFYRKSFLIAKGYKRGKRSAK